ncbi:MAG: molybdopterin molybdotransferase MoeA, partial [Myxococcota bacterium]|nr:molybdopterin molybdotransferase MoeA [Myxococcota bacterium]
ALTIVVAQASALPSKRVSLAESLGRVLAADVLADTDFPPFDKSCMDGFAARREDLTGPLRQVECIAAGQLPTHEVGPFECSRIMTGAMLPKGADVVFMVEHSALAPEGTVRFTHDQTADNIARRGEDLKQGEVVVRAGTLLRPRHIAALASVGAAKPHVHRRPVIGVLATGDELVAAHERPGPGQIRNSNSPQLMAQAAEAGCPATYLGVVSDDFETTKRAVGESLERCDVLLLSGGVSMGDFDHVPNALEACGVRILFDQVAVKPGKPTTFGMLGQKAVFGLPGNPVSTFVMFELLVRPHLMARMGLSGWRPVTMSAQLAQPIVTRKADREQWLPVAVDEHKQAVPLRFHGSGHFASLVGMSGLVCLPLGVLGYAAGHMVNVRLV